MSSRMLRRLLLALGAALFAAGAGATDLRGMVTGTHSYATRAFPARGVSVVLYQQRSGQWRRLHRTVTGPDGMYYLRNVAPGEYWLRVDRRHNYRITVRRQALQDIQPIRLRY